MTAVAVHPTNGRLAAAFQSGFIRIYEPRIRTKASGANRLVETVEEKVEQATVRYEWAEIGKWKCEMVAWLAWDTFQSSSPLVAAACADGSVKVFDQLGGYCTHNFRGHTAPVTMVKFDREKNGRASSYLLFSASSDATVRVWSLTESKQVALLKNHMSAVTDIDFINHEGQNRKLVTVGRDQIISVFHMTKGYPLYTTIPVYESLESCVVLTPDMNHPLAPASGADHSLILVTGESGILKVWNSKTAKCVFEQPKANTKSGIDYLIHVPSIKNAKKYKSKKSASKDSKDQSGASAMDEDTPLIPETKDDGKNEEDLIVAVTNDQNLILHPTATLEAGDTIVGYNDEIIDAVFVSSTDVAVATNATELRVFSLPHFSSRTFGLNDPTCAQHKESILALAISPCKQYIVTASKDQTLIVWSVPLARSVAQLTGHTQSIATVQFFNRTSRYIVSGGRDLTWKIWDIQAVLDKGHESRSGIDRVAGSILTVKAHKKDVNCAAVSPNDQLLATGSQDKEIKLYSLAKIGSRGLEEVATLRGHRRGVWDLAFSPVDQVLASCSADMTIKLWNLRDFTCIKTFEGHTASVLKMRFISNGLQLLSAGADGLVKVWNIHDNECVNTFDKHEDKIWALAVDPASDGEKFVTGGGDSMICLWRDNTEDEIEAEATQRDEMIQMEQSLSNFVRDKNFRKALKLALKLSKPLQTLNIIEAAIASGDGDAKKVDTILRGMLDSLDFDLTQQLLTYIRDWNTNAKHSLAAQAALFQLFHLYRADSMTKFPLMKQLLEALIPYSTRHFQRLDKLLQASYILDYTLQNMNLLPEIAPVKEEEQNHTQVKMEIAEEGKEAEESTTAMDVAEDGNADQKEEKANETPKKKKNAKKDGAATDTPNTKSKETVEVDEESEIAENGESKPKKRKRSHSTSSVGEKEDEVVEEEKPKVPQSASKAKSSKSAISKSTPKSTPKGKKK